MKRSPPVALVKTWLSLIKSKEANDVRNRASSQLIGAFGNMENVRSFMSENEIEW